MVRYISFLLFLGLVSGQTDYHRLILKSNNYHFPTVYVRGDSSIYSKKSSDLFLINYRLNYHISKNNEDVRIKARDFCYPDNKYHICSKAKERNNGIMISDIYKTPECIFSFYSSLDYGR